MKNIIVCIKQVLDPEAPLSLFKIDSEKKLAVLPLATPPVLSPYDENALEAALKIKDTQPANISVLSLGAKLTRDVLIASLAAGADQLFLLEDESFNDFNSSLTANALASAIKKLGQCDLILCGIQAADTNAGHVGIGIASLLKIPCITFARKVEICGDKVKVERILSEGYEVVEAPLPSVVTVSYEIGDLREPDIDAFMSAEEKPITVWNRQDLNLPSDVSHHTRFLKMYQPLHNSSCEIIAGANPEERGKKLAEKLKEIKIL